MHGSTCGSALNKLWHSSGTPPSFKGPYITRTFGLRRGMNAIAGAGGRPMSCMDSVWRHPGLNYYYYHDGIHSSNVLYQEQDFFSHRLWDNLQNLHSCLSKYFTFASVSTMNRSPQIFFSLSNHFKWSMSLCLSTSPYDAWPLLVGHSSIIRSSYSRTRSYYFSTCIAPTPSLRHISSNFALSKLFNVHTSYWCIILR